MLCLLVLLSIAGSEKDLQQKEAKLMELQEFYETQLLSHKVRSSSLLSSYSFVSSNLLFIIIPMTQYALETGAINRLHFSGAGFWCACHAYLGPDSWMDEVYLFYW